LNVAGYAWPTPKNGIYPRVEANPNHAFIIYDFPAWRAFDNYVVNGDFNKDLAGDYDFMDYGYRIYLREEGRSTEEPKSEVELVQKPKQKKKTSMWIQLLNLLKIWRN
jgi:hypothetical protein